MIHCMALSKLMNTFCIHLKYLRRHQCVSEAVAAQAHIQSLVKVAASYETRRSKAPATSRQISLQS